jgi:hypothetical protein
MPPCHEGDGEEDREEDGFQDNGLHGGISGGIMARGCGGAMRLLAWRERGMGGERTAL